jgi:hypothetical protein
VRIRVQVPEWKGQDPLLSPLKHRTSKIWKAAKFLGSQNSGRILDSWISTSKCSRKAYKISQLFQSWHYLLLT